MLFIGSHGSENHHREKTHATLKELLLNSLRENDTVEELEFSITSIIDPKEAITIINHYEEIIKTQNKKAIGYAAIQGQMSKRFKDTEDFIKNVGLSKSTAYFKIGLYKNNTELFS